jgi:hypothetical protein
MKKRKQANNRTILRGIILPAMWDKDGRVKRISLNTKNEHEYMIDYSGRGKELLNHLQETIELEGKVLQRMGGAFYIKVNSYRVIGDQ